MMNGNLEQKSDRVNNLIYLVVIHFNWRFCILAYVDFT